MRHPDIDYMMVMERRRDDLAEAERYRLIKEARAALQADSFTRQPARLRLVRDALLRDVAVFLSLLGQRMLTWSCQLRYRSELMANGATENRASPCT